LRGFFFALKINANDTVPSTRDGKSGRRQEYLKASQKRGFFFVKTNANDTVPSTRDGKTGRRQEYFKSLVKAGLFFCLKKPTPMILSRVPGMGNQVVAKNTKASQSQGFFFA